VTRNEAAERIKAIWGKTWPDECLLERPGYRNETVDWYVRFGREFHSIDSNGHTTCHPECAQLEEKAFGQKPVDEPKPVRRVAFRITPSPVGLDEVENIAPPMRHAVTIPVAVEIDGKTVHGFNVYVAASAFIGYPGADASTAKRVARHVYDRLKAPDAPKPTKMAEIVREGIRDLVTLQSRISQHEHAGVAHSLLKQLRELTDDLRTYSVVWESLDD
jgi:hypothetical protein